MEGLSKLGIDLWSILIYILNTGLLLAVLIYILYKPILKFLDERRRQIQSSVDEARTLKEELDKKSLEIEAANAKVETELKREMENLRLFTEKKRSELTAEMEQVRSEMFAKAEADISRRKGEILQDAESATLALIKKIVLHIIQNKVPANVIEESVETAWKTYKK